MRGIICLCEVKVTQGFNYLVNIDFDRPIFAIVASPITENL